MRQHHWHPPTDIFETDSALVIRAEISGMREDQFQIYMDQNHLSIQGTRADEVEKEYRRSFHQMEIHFGDFYIQVALNTPVDLEKVTAEYKNGFLKVTLPKTHPRQISIQED
jgi:HSP20 family protein